MIPMIKFSSYLRQDQESENKTENIKDKNLPEVIESKEFPDKKKSRNSHLLQCLENLKMKIKKNSLEKALNFTFCSYFKNKFKSFFRMKVDFEGQTILTADKMYEKEMDIVLLLKRIQNVEKLKCILLNRKQRIIFDLIKPKIHVVDSEEIASVSKEKWMDLSEITMKSLDIGQNTNNKDEEINNVLSFYEEKIRYDDEQITEIDRNLLDFFKE